MNPPEKIFVRIFDEDIYGNYDAVVRNYIEDAFFEYHLAPSKKDIVEKMADAYEMVGTMLNPQRRVKMPSELFVKFKSISKEDALTMVGKGWAGLIVELYDEKPEWVHVLYVKEKLGGLRFYVSSAPSHYLSLIDEAEKSSLHICEQCGKDGKLRTNRSWVATLCDECNGRRFEMTTQEKLSKFTDLSEIHEVHIDGVFSNKDELGFHLWWKGDKGFGSIRISEHIQNDMFLEIDSENMSKEFVAKVLLSLLVGAGLEGE